MIRTGETNNHPHMISVACDADYATRHEREPQGAVVRRRLTIADALRIYSESEKSNNREAHHDHQATDSTPQGDR